jgi:hypothetical protein
VVKKIDKLASGKREAKVMDVQDVDDADSNHQKPDEPAHNARDLEGQETEQYGYDDEAFGDHEPHQHECEDYELDDNEQYDENFGESFDTADSDESNERLNRMGLSVGRHSAFPETGRQHIYIHQSFVCCRSLGCLGGTGQSA